MASLVFRDHAVERVGGEAVAAEVQWRQRSSKLCKDKGGSSSKAWGLQQGRDNQGGAELSRALKEATRRMNLTLQLRHTQHCLVIMFAIQLQLSNFIS